MRGSSRVALHGDDCLAERISHNDVVHAVVALKTGHYKLIQGKPRTTPCEHAAHSASAQHLRDLPAPIRASAQVARRPDAGVQRTRARHRWCTCLHDTATRKCRRAAATSAHAPFSEPSSLTWIELGCSKRLGKQPCPSCTGHQTSVVRQPRPCSNVHTHCLLVAALQTDRGQQAKRAAHCSRTRESGCVRGSLGVAKRACWHS